MSENNRATSSPKVPAAKFGGKGMTVAIIVAAIITAFGLVLWGIQLTGGLV